MFKPSYGESSQLGFDSVQTKLRRIVSGREQLKIAFDPLHCQIRTGLLEIRDLLLKALIKADRWLMFFSLLLGSGYGLTVIDNLGQMSQSLRYDNTHVFVSMISIRNFLGRIGGGYFSEQIVSADDSSSN